MEITILEKSDFEIKLRVKGGSQSVLNMLKEEADSTPGVTFAGFVIEHPLERSSIFILKTESKDAGKTLKKIIEKTQDDLKTARKKIVGLF